MQQLSEVKEGSRVRIGGIVWDVLKNEEGKTLCITDEITGYKEFDEENCNDWKKSSLRKFLNTDFLESLLAKMGENGQGPEVILEQEQDLTADDGLTDYGSSADKVFLLTCEQYRKLRKNIRKLQDWWWLITADSTINHFARGVNADGSLYSSNAYNGDYGVRPACVFESSILVEVVE